MTKTKKQRSRRCSIYLNAETERKANIIGYGNVSHAMRVSVDIAFKKLGHEVEYRQKQS